MNQAAILKVPAVGYGKSGPGFQGDRRGAAISVALWLFIGVATALFLLFIAAYVMRMDASDWSPLAMPWQLWLSSALLALASVLLQLAARAASVLLLQRARTRLLAAGMCGCAFLIVQWWGWLALQAIHVTTTGNPAGSFFYLLTAMHGLHVAGGLVAWGITAAGARRQDAGRLAWQIRLCARYWHFLLAVWLLLFAVLGWLTPDVVRMVCGVR
ncbi:cytochrome c oxidase subunit III family protein [Collimonas arenae]|uniref:Cytochrome c oxidase subunit III family protein n=1 Tax=Collimonas arenae TaxID=279058 RepID=A0A127QKC0_9BURK|nr:bb3-type cytochrome oxidase subunit III [Collimonas arenae]AMP10488.1 cytochrome c oxidase subunit III family protein [Collimonas arenae]